MSCIFNLISLWWWYHFIAIIRQLASDSIDHWWRWRGNGGGLRHLLVCAVCRWCETLLDATATATAPRPFFLPVCQSVCVCMSMSVFVSQSVSCCCTEDLATSPVWAQCHLTGYSMYSLLSASWLYLFFSLLLSDSLLLFTTLFCFKFFFFFFVNTSALRWVFAESKSCRRGLFRACCRVSDSACVGAVWGQRFSFTERQWFKSLSYS